MLSKEIKDQAMGDIEGLVFIVSTPFVVMREYIKSMRVVPTIVDIKKVPTDGIFTEFWAHTVCEIAGQPLIAPHNGVTLRMYRPPDN